MCAHRRQPAAAASLMSSIDVIDHDLGRVRPYRAVAWRVAPVALRRCPGWIGLAIVVFWALAAVFGPALLPHDRAPSSAASFRADQRRAPARHRLSRPRHAEPRHRRARATRSALRSSRRCSPAAPARCSALFAAASGRWIDAALSRTLDRLIVDPEQDVRAGDGRRLRLVAAAC